MKMMENALVGVWRQFFSDWPASFAQKGVVLSRLDEQFPFSGFLVKGDVVVLERPTPDAVGGRRVVLPFEIIHAVKFTEPIKTEQLVAAGYRAPASKQAAAATSAKQPARA